MSAVIEDSSKVQILLVDDNPANLVVLKAILEGLSLTLVEANSGTEALHLLREGEFAVVLLDILMPGLDGFETAKRIRARAETRHTPIIFQTSFDTDQATIEKAYTLGAVDLLVKPLMPVVLRAKVMGFVELFQYRQQIKQQAEQLRQADRRAFEQQLAEENSRLQQQREWLRVTLESIGDAVLTTDPQGRVTFLNASAETLTGWRQDQAVDRPLTEVFSIVNERTRQTVEHPVAKVLATGHIVGLANHTVLIAKDGTERAIDDSASPIRDNKGSIAGVVLIFRDVTDQRKAERSARFLAAIVESCDDAIIGKDINGIITSWNQSAERMFGYTAAEAVGCSVAMLAPPDRADEMPAILNRIRQGERVDHFDTVRRAKDGRLVSVALTVSPIRDEDGNIIGASKITRDISERKLAENALREEKERLHATLSGIGDAVIVTDAKSRVTLMNPVAQTLTGCQGEVTGRPLQDVFHIINEQTRQPVESPVDRVLREGMVVGLANHTVLVAWDGTERPIEDSAAPIRDERGAVVGVVLVFRDATERRAAEAATHKHQQILKLVHQIGKIGHWEWDSLTDENRWSPEIEALYGLPPGGFVGGYQEWTKLLHPDDLSKAEADVRRALQTGEYFTEFRVVWPDGSVHWLETRAYVFKDGHDQPVRVVGVNMDITERKRQEEALRASEQRWRTLAEALPNLVWTSLPDGQCDWLSSQWGKYTGIPEQELLGQRWLQTVHPDDREYTLACWQAACADQADYDLEYRIRRYDGEYHWFKTRGVPIRNEQGQIVYWFGTCTDIEDTKKIGERLRLLWEAASVLLTTTEPDAMLRGLFAKIGPYFGFDTYFHYMVNEAGDALRLVSCLDIPEEATQQIARFEFGQAISGTVALQRQPLVATYIQQSEDPKVQWVKSLGIRAYACNPLQINDNLLGTLSFASRSRDQFAEDELEFLRTLSHYVAVAAERMRLVRQLRAADRRKDEFLATLAHELRNPLAPLRNAVELLCHAAGDASVIEQARSMMGRQVDQMVRLIDDLLDMSRISQGKVRLRKERVELKTIVRSALEAVQPFLKAQTHELTVALPPEAVYLDADATRLAQVISNLLNNAAKYTEKGGHIWLTAERQGNEAVVVVRDTGIGIAAEHLPHLFEMFSQVAPALERSQGGLGIGLSLVRGLVELHGGRVEARSGGIGRGSEFTVCLPIMEMPVAQESPPAPEDKIARGRKQRILAVDDNRDAADSLALMLRLLGHELRTAYDGLEAVQAAATFRPDVVLLDIGLPKMNGYEVARQIRQQRWGEHMALIALTGWGQEEDKRRALEAGFDHHLTKPVEIAALERLLALIHPTPRQRET